MLPEPLVSDPESECRVSDVSDPLAAPRSPPLALGAVILLLAVSASPPHWPQLRGPGRFIGVGARDKGGPRREGQSGVCQNMSSGQVDILYDGGILKRAQLQLLYNPFSSVHFHIIINDNQFSMKTRIMCSFGLY